MNETSAVTHKSVLVGDVVGEFEFVERDRFAHPLFASRRRVRVDVHALRHLRVGLAGHQPAGVLEFVAAVVDGSDVHRQDVLTSTFQAADLHLERWKHSPTRMKLTLVFTVILCTGLPLSFLSWAYVPQGVYFWAYDTPGASIFGIFVREGFRFSA